MKYIGQTGRPVQRKSKHKKRYPYLEFTPMMECDSLMEVLLWEFLLIELLSPVLNIVAGGGSSPTKDPAVRKKIRETMKRYLEKNPDKHPMKNPEVRKKLSESKKRYHKENPDKNPMKNPEVAARMRGEGNPKARAVLCIAPDGTEYKYGAAAKAARELTKKYGIKFYRQNISAVATGKYPFPHYKGWKFQYV